MANARGLLKKKMCFVPGQAGKPGFFVSDKYAVPILKEKMANQRVIRQQYGSQIASVPTMSGVIDFSPSPAFSPYGKKIVR